MKDPKVRTALIISAVLIIGSIVPVVQIMIMYLNGGILYLVSQPFSGDPLDVELIFNVFMSIILVRLLYSMKKPVWFTIVAILSTVFIYPTITYRLTGVEESGLYFLPFMFAGIITGALLVGVGLIKNKQTGT